MKNHEVFYPDNNHTLMKGDTLGEYKCTRTACFIMKRERTSNSSSLSFFIFVIFVLSDREDLMTLCIQDLSGFHRTPPIHILPEPHNRTSFGNRVFMDVIIKRIEVDHTPLGCDLNSMQMSL